MAWSVSICSNENFRIAASACRLFNFFERLAKLIQFRFNRNGS